MKHYKEHNDHDKENEQSAPRPSRLPSVLPTITTKVRMSVSMANLKLCSEMEDSEQGKKQKPTDSTHHDKHSDHDKDIDQSAPRLSRSKPALPATMTMMRMSSSMTNLKLCSEMEDSEQGKKQKPMDSTRHDKERKDHDKEIKQSAPRPPPLPATKTTMKCSEMEDSDQGEKKEPTESTHDYKEEHKDDDKESEQPEPRPSGSPSPLPPTMTTMECSEMEDSDQGEKKEPTDSTHDEKEHKDDDEEREQPAPGSSSPLPETTSSETEDHDQDKKHEPTDSTDDKESEQPAPGSPSPLPETTTMKESLEMEDHEQGKKQEPTDSAHDKETEQPAPGSPSPLPATATINECLEPKDNEQGKKQEPMDLTQHNKEHKDQDKESEQPAPRSLRSLTVSPLPTMRRLRRAISMTMHELLRLEDDETNKLQKPTSPTLHDKENERPAPLPMKTTERSMSMSMSMTMKESLPMEVDEINKMQNPDSSSDKPLMGSSSTQLSKEQKDLDKEIAKKLTPPPFIPTNSCLIIKFPLKHKYPEEEPPKESDDDSDYEDFDPLKGSIFDIAETPKTEAESTNQSKKADDEFEEVNNSHPDSNHVDEEGDRTRTRRLFSKLGGLIGVRNFYRREQPPVE
ncbi:nucleolar and coiled-body phosphoprotein 1-like [Hibiscus syriacus]|nr:nucleolar and coiled-body phosphoprotein 1-like [Hibiscus syriacus]